MASEMTSNLAVCSTDCTSKQQRKVPVTGPMLWESNGHKWIPLTKYQQCGKYSMSWCHNDTMKKIYNSHGMNFRLVHVTWNHTPLFLRCYQSSAKTWYFSGLDNVDTNHTWRVLVIVWGICGSVSSSSYKRPSLRAISCIGVTWPHWVKCCAWFPLWHDPI